MISFLLCPPKRETQTETQTQIWLECGECEFLDEHNKMDVRLLLQNSSTSSTDSSTTREDGTAHQMAISGLLLIFFCSVVGNMFVVVVILLERKMKTFTNWMILNLAVADLAVGLFCIPLEIPLELKHKWLYGKVFCKLFYPLQSSIVYASVLTLAVTSCSRYYAIAFPFRPQPTARHAR